MRFAKVAAVLVTLSITAAAQAATYYVATSGNDANAGTLSAPLRTITAGVKKLAAGDTLYVRGGSYNESVNIWSKSGTASAPITVSSYPGETALVDGTATTQNAVIQIGGNSTFIHLENFEVANGPKSGILVYDANNLIIRNNNVHHNTANGLYVTSASTSPLGTTHDVRVEGNLVHHNVTQNQYQTAASWQQGLSALRANNVDIINNEVYQNWGEGLDFILSTGGTISGNSVHDNFSVNMYLDNARSVTVTRNLIYSTSDTSYFRSGSPASGIQLANEAYTYTNPLSDIDITNNIVTNVKRCFYYSNYENGGGLKNVVVANNTFYKATAEIIAVNNDAHSNSFVENNIIYQVGGLGPNVAGAGVTYRNNNWYGVASGSAAGTGDVVGNPAFVNAGGFSASDYKITLASAAIGRGFDASSIVSVDHFGITRITPFDIGAHQFSSGAAVKPAPTLDTIAPSIPGNLRVLTAGPAGVTLSWNAATDNVGVSVYKIYRRGVEVAAIAATTWTDTNLADETSYSYAVKAVDAAGNLSGSSDAVSVSSSMLTDGDAPTAPAALRASEIAKDAVLLSWNGSTDNVGVTGYRVFRGTTLVATVTTTSYRDLNLTAGTTYTYQISAVDKAGNQSGGSNVLTVATTAAIIDADTIAPTAPVKLAAAAVTATSVSLGWSASRDDVAVVRYDIYRGNVKVGSASSTTWTDRMVLAGQSYTYQVFAFDAAGNRSSASNTITVKTPASAKRRSTRS
ncbi:MAG TPA: right-handed parallel beta-helix repeat-containing protein [Thermoanaerobaculia bacterium]|jgi:parallel beta-helix repeat protein